MHVCLLTTRFWLDILSGVDGGDDMVAMLSENGSLDPWGPGDQGGMCLGKGRE